ELAIYERMPDQLINNCFFSFILVTIIELERDGFSQNPFYHCLVAEVPETHKSTEGHTTVGYVLYYYTYSTWKGRCIYMEDLYVMPDFRERGIGKSLVASIAKVGTEQQCMHLQFSVLDWNKPSLDFYMSKGAQDLTAKEGWHLLRFDGVALIKLAQEAP
ncbi:hypothetical protein P4O66_016114, partial [Electrophorus voltai]